MVSNHDMLYDILEVYEKYSAQLSFINFSEEGELKGEEFFSTVRPEEIPDIPSQKFLYRGSPQGQG